MGFMILVLSGLFPAQSSQDAEWVEIRFHRVHLRNGNFIDGQILKDLPAEVLLKLRVGEISIKRDQIDRVEIIKLRSVNEKPIVKTPPKGPDRGPQPLPSLPLTPVTTPQEIQRKVEGILKTYAGSKAEERGPLPVAELAALGEEAAAFLAARLPDFDGTLQRPVVAALGELKSPKAIAILEAYAAHPNPVVRGMTVTALGLMGDVQREKSLRPFLQDKDPAVRKTTLSMIGTIENPDWFRPISDLCADEDKDVRNSAISISSQMASKLGLQEEFLRILIGNLNRSSGGVKVDMVASIGGYGKAEHWSILAPLLRDTDAAVRTAVAMALSKLGAPDSGPEIVSQLPVERDHWTRVYLASAAQRLKLTKAVEPLIDWLGDPDEEIRRVASIALQAITGQILGVDREKWAIWLEQNKSK